MSPAPGRGRGGRLDFYRDTGPKTDIRRDGVACTSRRQKLPRSPTFGKAFAKSGDRMALLIFLLPLLNGYLCY